MNIVLCGDKNVLGIGSITILSLISHCDTHKQYNIHFLHSGDCPMDMLLKLKSIGTQNVKINLVNMEKYDKSLSDIDTKRYKTPSLYRLVLPEVFPNLDKVLYLDTDILVREDISKLFDIELKNDNWLIAAHINPHIYTMVKNMFAEKRSDFNSGVLLINLNEWRKRNIQHKVIELLRNDVYSTPDQTVLSIACHGFIEQLPLTWNHYPIFNRNANIVHFQMNSVKYLPLSNKYKREWIKYAIMSPFEFDFVEYNTGTIYAACAILIILLCMCVGYVLWKCVRCSSESVMKQSLQHNT